MRRLVFCALACFATLPFGSGYASEAATTEKVVAKVQCKKVKGKCVKPQKKRTKHRAKVNAKPLATVSPSIPKNYTPPRSVSKRMAATIDAYKSCMYDEGDRLERALERNFSYRDDEYLGGAPEKLGNEVCLADALGLKRYETLADISAAKGTELVEVPVSSALIFSDQLPGERRFARPWVRDYLETLARDMERKFGQKDAAGWKVFTPMRIGSLVRSFKDQRRQTNSPAACRNEICSTHTTGAAVDISNNLFSLGRHELKWLRERLLEDRKKGKIVMIQERSPPHFHMLVLPPEFVPSANEQ